MWHNKQISEDLRISFRTMF